MSLSCITDYFLQSFYIYLYLISITFLLYVYVFLLRRRNPQACYRRSVASSLHTPEDSLLRSTSRRSGAAGGGGGVVGDYSSAGSFYLRLGAVGESRDQPVPTLMSSVTMIIT